jgi:hypothetical protein
MPDLPTSACWSEAAARAVLQTEALANREAAFLATHQPIRDFGIAGARGGEIAEPSDAAVLAALSAPDIRHAFCVVEGEPGSGKSHLVRWLKVQWPHDDLVLLIQRADGSLTGTLRELQRELGAAYGHLFDRLGQSLQATFVGRVALFHAGLVETLRPGFFETPLEDEEWCGRWELRQLLGHPVVRDWWEGPKRILEVMSGLGGERNSASARFDLYDVADLARLAPAIDKPPPKAFMFLRQLAKESARLEPARAEGIPAGEILEMSDLDVPESRRLMEALNRRRDFAVQNVLGISADGLKQMFLDLRRQLKGEGRRLVLLLEDVTSWEGVDNQLVDALVTDSRTREKPNEDGELEADVCDLISVAGMTPRYLRDLHGNYLGRITHSLRLGREDGRGGFQLTTQLATPDAQVAFAANYLRAVRADPEELEVWRRRGADPASLPNRCGACPIRPACHPAFGAYEGIGLFPFTERSIIRLFEALVDPKGKMTLQTPRGMIQGVLSPVLLKPSRLDDGGFPPPELEAAEWLPDEVRRPSSFLAQTLEAAEPDAERRDRLRRLVMLWGGDQLSTSVLPDGSLAYAGIPRAIFDAFGLTWLGEATDQIQPPAAPVPQPAIGLTATSGTATESPGAKPSPVRPPLTTKPAVPPSPTMKRVDAKKLLDQCSQVHDWRDGKGLREPKQWEATLAEIMGLLPRARLGIPRLLWDRLFTPETVRLEGAGRADVRTFVLPREDWVVRGLEAYVTLRGGDDLSSEQVDVYRRNHCRMLRRLGELAVQHARKRLSARETPWSPAAACAQVLLARAWLRGSTSPDKSLTVQFAELLSEERAPTSNPEDRVDSWGELLGKTAQTHQKLRGYLHQLLALPQGEREAKSGLLDAGEVAVALTQLRQTMRLVEIPDRLIDSKSKSQTDSSGLDEVLKIAELAYETDEMLRQIPDRELRRIEDRAAKALALLREHSIAGHRKRVDAVLAKVGSLLIQAAPQAIDEWHKAVAKLDADKFMEERPDAPAPAQRLQDFLLEERDRPDPPAEKLTIALAAPVRELGRLLDLLEIGEKAVGDVFAYVSAYLIAAGNDGDLAVVNGFGRSLAARTKTIRDTVVATV